jgi:hypothetical protein
MNITTVGVDLAKIVFQVHGVDARGKVAVHKQLKRSQVMGFFTQLPACLIGMEACGGAHLRPGSTKPNFQQGILSVRYSDQASTSEFHQGPRFRFAHTGRMYGCNQFP